MIKFILNFESSEICNLTMLFEKILIVLGKDFQQGNYRFTLQFLTGKVCRHK